MQHTGVWEIVRERGGGSAHGYECTRMCVCVCVSLYCKRLYGDLACECVWFDVWGFDGKIHRHRRTQVIFAYMYTHSYSLSLSRIFYHVSVCIYIYACTYVYVHIQACVIKHRHTSRLKINQSPTHYHTQPPLQKRNDLFNGLRKNLKSDFNLK